MGITVVERDYGFLCSCDIKGNKIERYYHGRGERAFEHAFVKFSRFINHLTR
jgi:hypothetical protein